MELWGGQWRVGLEDRGTVTLEVISIGMAWSSQKVLRRCEPTRGQCRSAWGQGWGERPGGPNFLPEVPDCPALRWEPKRRLT